MTPQSLDMITRLVGFDTVSRNSNMQLIEYVRDYLAGHGIDSQLVKSQDGKKSNLFASIGPDVEGGVVLSGHTDVVPVDGQPWDTDPFVLTEKDGKLYGRGTCDMKSFIAVALAAVPDMLSAGLARPIHFALSYDEEVGCVGAPALIERMVHEIAKPSAVIVGEPTSMQPISAHKGLGAVRTTVIGHEAHSSQMQRGVSAVMTAARLITFLDDMMLSNKAKARPDCAFVPPYTTVHVGLVHGGTALNIISRECSFTWDVRTLPDENWRDYLDSFERYANSLLPAMQAISPSASITTEVLAEVPPLIDSDNDEAQRIAMKLSGCSCCGVVPYVTEGGQFSAHDLSVVVYGPGSIDQAHQPNEYIEVSQVDECEVFVSKLIDQLKQ
ncbi:acetylornithine deacetylase [Pollutimonas harenae]|uniref:Acetylornithine deacetylase n=1 Tax=Pollutimonas harenae TaxID=657015 RepID=A0A853H083_9BURK|nr:acetylornithine deacetylase [Pollutimonas harenae]NYT86396.1 acetylornithine deacetylase [Pollutimonas harenae]TEA69850.1 acetylornithine deacetylase [Pollutimonas harenae]